MSNRSIEVVAVSPRFVARVLGVSPSTAVRIFKAAGATVIARRSLRLPVSQLTEVFGPELAKALRAQLAREFSTPTTGDALNPPDRTVRKRRTRETATASIT